jgi:DNA-binding MarR family transcriptional regulator
MNMDDDDVREATRALRRGTLRLAHRLRVERPRHGISLQKLGLLVHLSRNGPMSAGELAAADHVQPQSLSRALASLHSAGLILRTVDPQDHRRAQLEITLEGTGVVHADMHQRDLWLSQAITEQLSPTERELLRLAGELMQRLAEIDRPQPS